MSIWYLIFMNKLPMGNISRSVKIFKGPVTPKTEPGDNYCSPVKMETIHITHTFITCRQLQKGSRIIVMMGVNKNPSWGNKLWHRKRC